MNETYYSPDIEVIYFEAEDVITTSGDIQFPYLPVKE